MRIDLGKYIDQSVPNEIIFTVNGNLRKEVKNYLRRQNDNKAR